MSDNPYHPPQEASNIAQHSPAAQKEQLRRVAAAQRFVCQVILLAIVLNIFGIAVANAGEIGRVLSLLLSLGVAIGQFVGMYKLGRSVYDSTAFGCMMMFLALIPCFGLIALLVVNGQATKMLQSAGYKVGLMGAKLSQFD